MRRRPALYCLLIWGAVLLLTQSTLYTYLRTGGKPSIKYNTVSKLPVKLSHKSYITEDELLRELYDLPNQGPTTKVSDCRMDTCFNFTRCRHGFRVYVYPLNDNDRISKSYQSILDIVRSSPYYTTNPDEGCIFISSIDTLDHDIRSLAYKHNLQEKLTNLPYWNGGMNHLIFNMYSGTWPDYSENLGVDIGYAMVAKASVSAQIFRVGFDISLPLFHDTLPVRNGQSGVLSNINVPSNREYLLAFKGKRYLTGVGSESRDRLYHLHNGKDIIMLTTCKHGKGWEKFADDRCALDIELYDKYDYQSLLINSTFCLVPRGRRLGSYRFLEVLQYGCIPVLLSDSWELPFSDVIDWKQAAIWADEDQMYQIPYMIRSIPYTSIISLQQQTQHLWSKYFNSIEKIVLTVLQIVQNRIEPHKSLSSAIWMTHPGPNVLSASYTRDLSAFPFFVQPGSNVRYTVLLYVREYHKHFKKTLESIVAADYVQCIYLFVIGNSSLKHHISAISQTLSKPIVKIHVINTLKDSLSLFNDFPTDAVLFINQRSYYITKELDFTFSVWKEYPERIVGHLARSYLWHEGLKKYHFSSKISNEYSIVLPDMAVFHKYYIYKALEYADIWDDDNVVEQCFDMLLNFIVSDITRLPPIKLGQRLSFKESLYKPSNQDILIRSGCMNTLFSKFGYIPLKTSHVRYDPALFKDNVAKMRKKYLTLESV